MRMGTLKRNLLRRMARMRLHSRQREVALATILTLAAALFLTAALVRKDQSPDRLSHSSVRKANP